MRTKATEQSLLGPIDRYWTVKIVFGVLWVFCILRVLLAACVLGGLSFSNSHPGITGAPLQAAIWYSGAALACHAVFTLTERRRRQALQTGNVSCR
ncbi:MAG: hypothetical protein WD009_06470 [Phycisphaeraceae bacterium]